MRWSFFAIISYTWTKIHQLTESNIMISFVTMWILKLFIHRILITLTSIPFYISCIIYIQTMFLFDSCYFIHMVKIAVFFVSIKEIDLNLHKNILFNVNSSIFNLMWNCNYKMEASTSFTSRPVHRLKENSINLKIHFTFVKGVPNPKEHIGNEQK